MESEVSAIAAIRVIGTLSIPNRRGRLSRPDLFRVVLGTNEGREGTRLTTPIATTTRRNDTTTTTTTTGGPPLGYRSRGREEIAKERGQGDLVLHIGLFAG